MPLTNSYNSLAQSNEQPEYQALWEPFAVDPASSSAITIPTAAGAVAGCPVACCRSTPQGWARIRHSASAPPTRAVTRGARATRPSRTTGRSSTWIRWSVRQPANMPYIAGVLLGVGTLGAPAPAVPNTIAGGPSLVAMVAKRGLVQAWVDTTTTIGHTQNISTTSGHVGQWTDSGGTTRTIGTTVGIALQTVTISSSIPQLCWININIT